MNLGRPLGGIDFICQVAKDMKINRMTLKRQFWEKKLGGWAGLTNQISIKENTVGKLCPNVLEHVHIFYSKPFF